MYNVIKNLFLMWKPNLQVYICGGFNGFDCLETCEFYEPETNQWTMFTSMMSQRSGFGLITYAGEIYAVSK